VGDQKPRLLARRPLASFFALSILFFLPLFAAAGVAVTLNAPVWLQYLTQALSAWSPTMAAMIVTAALNGSAGVRALLIGFAKWRVKPIWYLFAAALPIAIGYAAAGIYALIVGPTPGMIVPLTAPALLVTVLNHLFRGPLGEEAGWRGFALPRLQARYTPFRSSLILGLGMLVWHIPTFFIQGLSGTALLLFMVSFAVALLSFTIVMTWLFNHTGGSLLLAALMHLSFNVSLSVVAIPLQTQLAIVAGLYLVLAAIVTLLPAPRDRAKA